MRPLVKQLYVPYFKERNRKVLYSLNRLKGMNMKESALKAGFPRSTAAIAGERLEPGHNLRIKEALESRGVTPNRLAQVIEDGLNATKIVKHEGEVVDYKERREYTRLSLEALGELKTGAAVAIQINLPAGFTDTWGEEDTLPPT